MLAVVMAIATFGKYWKAGVVLIHCDNKAVVDICNSRTAKHKPLTMLLRRLFFLELDFDIHVVVVHIKGEDNVIADAISRFEWAKLYNLLDESTCVEHVPNWDCVKTFSEFDPDLLRISVHSSNTLQHVYSNMHLAVFCFIIGNRDFLICRFSLLSHFKIFFLIITLSPYFVGMGFCFFAWLKY